MKQESKTEDFIFQSVSRANTVNMNAPPLDEGSMLNLYTTH
jgi:hypothetical protein